MTFNVCPLDAYVQLCYRLPQFGLALSWLAVQEAATYAEHIVDLGRRTPIERLAHFLLELHCRLLAVGRAGKASFDLPFSQEVMADVLGLSVPHLNRVMQQLRAEKLIVSRSRLVEFVDAASLQALAHYQPQTLAPIPMPSKKSYCIGRHTKHAATRMGAWASTTVTLAIQIRLHCIATS
jgi:hypothetical protein